MTGKNVLARRGCHRPHSQITSDPFQASGTHEAKPSLAHFVDFISLMLCTQFPTIPGFCYPTASGLLTTISYYIWICLNVLLETHQDLYLSHKRRGGGGGGMESWLEVYFQNQKREKGNPNNSGINLDAHNIERGKKRKEKSNRISCSLFCF